MKYKYTRLICGALFFALCLMISITSIGQTRCYSDQATQERIENDPEYRIWLKEIQNQLHNKVELSKSVSCSDPLIIPVAVHYSGGVTDANTSCLIDKALEQVDVLNEDFGGYNSDISNYCDLSEFCCDQYPADAITQGTCLQFCLASLDHPSGETVIGGYAITVGDHSWPTAAPWNGYLNFFVEDGLGILGQAFLDGGADPDGGGVQILAAAFGGATGGCTSGVGIDTDGTYNLGRTGTHEVGHFFGLEHVFNGCSSVSGPDFNTNNGDGIDDTPEQNNENYNCPTTDTGDCSSTSEDCGTADFYFNYMDYVDDDCMYMFTEDQGQHMYDIVGMAGTGGNEAYKSEATVCDDADIPTYSPTYPSGCPSTTLPDSDFTPIAGAIDICPGMEEIDFLDASTGCSVTGWNWTFSGAGVSPTSSTLQNPTVTVSSTGTLNVTLESTNASGTDPTPESKNYTITIFSSGDPECIDCGNTFTDSGGTGSDYGNNEDMEWTFCGAPGELVEVEFTDWDVEENASCSWDALEVHDGSDTSDPSLGVYCGNVLSEAPGGGTISSTGQCITFHFTSDGDITGDGWEATISCLVAPTCSDGIQNGTETGIDCGGDFCDICELTCDDDFVDSGGTGGEYSNNEMIETLVCPDACTDMEVTFSFVDIEAANNGGNNGTGCWDYLTIYDGDNSAANVLGNFCGEDSGDGDNANVPANDLDVGDIISTTAGNSTGCMLFVFTTDNIITEGGFEATFNCCLLIPVKMIEFNALAGANDITLQWATALEIQNKGFTIEKSIDGINFEDIGFLEGALSSFTRKDYQFVDREVTPNVQYYYRLLQEDLDGGSEYSAIRSARIHNGKGTQFKVVPNPNNGVFRIQSLKDNEHNKYQEILILDKIGRVVTRIPKKDMSLEELEINISDLTSGVFHIMIITHDVVEIHRIVVIN